MRKRVQRTALLAKSRTAKGVRAVRSVVSVGRGGTFYDRVRMRDGRCKVCVVRKVGGIGDLLMITPSLRQLRIDFPELEIHYAIDMHRTGNNIYHDLMKNAEYVNQLVDARYVNHSAYDEIVDISSVCIRYEHKDLPSINRVDLFARALGIPRLHHKRSWYRVEPQEAAVARARVHKARQDGKKIVALHTASMEGKRCWPSEKNVQLVEQAADKDIHFVVFDFNNTYDGWSRHKNVTVASQTTLREMAALIAESDLFIGPDSGPMHLAGALGVRSLVLFGSIPPEARINYYTTHTAVRDQTAGCLGCWYAACPYNIKCMSGIAVSRVYDLMASILGA